MDTDTFLANSVVTAALCPRCGRSASGVRGSECPYCGARLSDSQSILLDPTIILPASGLSARVMPEVPVVVKKDELIGQQLDVYRIDAVLGKGGMGRVYLAHHGDLHRPCALKILLPERVAEDAEYVQRFTNEGRAAASLVHPNIVTIHAIGAAQGYSYLEMEFVAGRSLRQLIHDEVRLSPVRATGILARVADALGAAHRQQIIHQDLKPDNIMLTLQGIPKLTDFGLAKRIRDDGETRSDLCGTPHYMAPELFQGASATPASDVYALGVTFFLAMTGRFPFDGESLTDLAAKTAHEPVPSIRSFIPEVSLEIAECVSRMLDKSPANRPQNGIEAAHLLGAVLGEARDLESLVDEAFRDDSRVSWIQEGQRFRLLIHLEGGRRQTVFVEPSQPAAADALLTICSTCCPAEPAYFEIALRLNSDMPHGGVGIRDVDGQGMFVVLDTYPRSTVDAEEVRKSAHAVASRADAIEKLLTGLDIQ